MSKEFDKKQDSEYSTDSAHRCQSHNQVGRSLHQKNGGLRAMRLAAFTPEESARTEQGSVTFPCLTHNSSLYDTQLDPQVYLERLADPNATKLHPRMHGNTERERDPWAGTLDPLLARSRPTVANAAHGEAEDIQRTPLATHTALPYPPPSPLQLRPRRFSLRRVILLSVIALALSALLIDGLLLAFAMHPAQHTPTVQGSLPALILSNDVAYFGQTISVQLLHFTPLGRAVLTHDRSQAWLTPARLPVDANGQATAVFTVTTSWSIGFHMIVAQDLTTSKTARVLLQVDDTTPSPIAPSAALMSVFPSSLSFSTIEAQNRPRGQVFTIINSGGSMLQWWSAMTTSAGAAWLTLTPPSGRVPPDSASQVAVNITTTSLAPGTYTAHIALHSGATRSQPALKSFQTLAVSLLVQPPCSLAYSAAKSLLFTGLTNSADPAAQTVTFTAAGSCAWPLHWQTSVAPGASWLTLLPTSGTLAFSSRGGSITTNVSMNGLKPGTYTTSLTVSAVDATGTPVHNSSQTFTVTLTVQQACTLQLLPTELAFSAAQGAPSTSQTFTLSTTGLCVGGVAWTADTDADSAPWLSLSTHGGFDSGSGSSLVVTVTPGNLAPRTYTGHITISAYNNGTALQESPQTLDVTLTLTGEHAEHAPK